MCMCVRACVRAYVCVCINVTNQNLNCYNSKSYNRHMYNTKSRIDEFPKFINWKFKKFATYTWRKFLPV